MKYVLDSNVAIKWVLPEPDNNIAVRLRNEYALGLHELIGQMFSRSRWLTPWHERNGGELSMSTKAGKTADV